MPTHQPRLSLRPRWQRYTLRSALIVVTLACVWLGLQVTRVRQQQEAIRRVESLGGQLRFYQRPNVPSWLRRALGDDYFRKVVVVGFDGGADRVVDQDLAALTPLTDLTELDLNRCSGITDAGLVHLAGLTELRRLSLYRTKVSGPGLRHLPPNLEVLNLKSTPLRDEGLAHLKPLSKLRWLQLGHTAISDRGLAELSGIVTLEGLQLQYTPVTDVGLDSLKPLRGLQSLCVPGTDVSGAALTQLQGILPKCLIMPSERQIAATPREVRLWPEGHQPTKAEIVEKVQALGGMANRDTSYPDGPIVAITFQYNRMSDESLLNLLAHTPELERLTVQHALAGDGLARGLPRLSKLSVLLLDDSRITDEGLVFLGQMQSLRELSLQTTRVSDIGLQHLSGLKELQSLEAFETRTSAQGRATLRQALPNCRIQD